MKVMVSSILKIFFILHPFILHICSPGLIRCHPRRLPDEHDHGPATLLRCARRYRHLHHRWWPRPRLRHRNHPGHRPHLGPPGRCCWEEDRSPEAPCWGREPVDGIFFIFLHLKSKFKKIKISIKTLKRYTLLIDINNINIYGLCYIDLVWRGAI